MFPLSYGFFRSHIRLLTLYARGRANEDALGGQSPPYISGDRDVQFSLRRLLLFFVVVWSAMATFGAWGIAVVACLGIAMLSIQSPARRRGLILACGILFFLYHLMAPAVVDSREACRQASCTARLKQIVIALQNYEDDHGSLPPAYIADANGKPMHSWRVLILPYLDGGAAVYQQYRFDEPWNGPNNKKLATNIPQEFRCPTTDEAEPGSPLTTHYVAVTGPGTAWPGPKATRTKDFRDGPANTILIAEIANSEISWMEPRDVTLDEALLEGDDVHKTPSSHHSWGDNFFTRTCFLVGNIAMADGSCFCLEKRPSRDELAALFSINNRESVDQTTVRRWQNTQYHDEPDLSRLLGFVLLMISSILLVSRPFGRGPSATNPGNSVADLPASGEGS